MQLPDLYRQMARARAFELAVADLWDQGRISGEMHLGTGEEAVAAGVVSHLRDGDGLSLAHRPTAPLVVRGVPLVELLREFLGLSDGLCGGQGGHMHLFSQSHLAASSGIVGASLPIGAGFALAAKRRRPGSLAAAFIGDGALNQGMALETLNLAVAWALPLVVVCIDNGWAITTAAGSVTGGDLRQRAHAFGWRVEQVDDPLLRQAHDPMGEEGRGTLTRVFRSAKSSGTGLASRAGSMARMAVVMSKARRAPEREGRQDPLRKARQVLRKQADYLERIEREVSAEIEHAVETALGGGEQ
jgi:TPP-dependent pyruvate/acetoin dehydrogenase alpha subunit